MNYFDLADNHRTCLILVLISSNTVSERCHILWWC